MNDMLAIGLTTGLLETGLRIPQDISLIGIDNMLLGSDQPENFGD
jgi:DNA-binding LacI/PurR family transcriptional regulator